MPSPEAEPLDEVEAPTGGLFAEVALPLPLPVSYSYLVPDTLADRVVAGARVVVPLRGRELVGIVTGLSETRPAFEPRPILAAPDPEPAIPEALLELAEWIAGYYASPLGIVLKAMVPGPLWGASEVGLALNERVSLELGGVAGELVAWLDRRGGRGSIRSAERALKKSLWKVADRLARVEALRLEITPVDTDANRATTRMLELAGPPLSLLDREKRFARRRRQREIYEALEGAGGPLAVEDLEERFAVSPSVIKGLVDAGMARLTLADRHRDPFAALPVSPPPPRLTAAQETAVEAIEALAPGRGALVFGVTGSGKTLVYLEALRRAVATGAGAIILVPEIGLTPQTVARVRGAFGDRVAVLHSALSDGERADAWRAVRRGERTVVVGPRSAVFAPVKNLAFIVVDEEHDGAYKNGEAPRYHAREVAEVRCRLEKARLILGSATPSLETASAVPDRFRMIRLAARVHDRPLPPVELIDMRSEPRVKGIGSVPWSETLDRRLRETVAKGEQALLLLNRRGFSSFLQCPACGEVPACPHCSISLTVHRAPPSLLCHYCGHSAPPLDGCPRCASPIVRAAGFGTQQVEQVVAERVPEARIARMDLDTTGSKWSHHRILERVGKGEVDVLIGTQMVAKGIDFPNVTLVGVVDADLGLHLPDFRAAERTFQLLTQVAGRAGRGPKGGRVLVQTRNPDHPALRFAVRHDTEGFWAAERAVRLDPPYPPTLALVNVVYSGLDERRVTDLCLQDGDRVSELIAKRNLEIELLGPAPCPIARIKDRFRWHFLLRGPDRVLGGLVRYLATKLDGGQAARIAIDRGPISLL